MSAPSSRSSRDRPSGSSRREDGSRRTSSSSAAARTSDRARDERDRHASSSTRHRSSRSSRRGGDEEAGNDDLMVGFEHRMSTEERRRMRLRDEAGDIEPPGGRRVSSSTPTEPTELSYDRARPSRSSSAAEERVSSTSSSTRRTAYSRALEKQERTSSRREGEKSHRSSERRHREGEGGDSRRRSEESEARRERRERGGDEERSSRSKRASTASSSSRRTESGSVKSSEPRDEKKKSSRSSRHREETGNLSPKRETDSERRHRRSIAEKLQRSADERPVRSREDEKRAREREHRRSSKVEDVERRRPVAERGGEDYVALGERDPRTSSRVATERPRERDRVSTTDRHRTRPERADPPLVDPPSREVRHSRRESSASAASSSRETSSYGRRSITSGVRNESTEDGGTRKSARERLRERMNAEKARDVETKPEASVPLPSHRTQTNETRAIDPRRDRTRDEVVKETRVVQSSSSSESDFEEESSIESDSDSSVYGVESSDEDEESWTVRVSVISAADLPPHIIPNLPLCPVMKLGLIKIPEDTTSGNAESSGGVDMSITNRMEKSGLVSFPNSRVRCTSNKIVSRRDNGSIEFHEEMRWDDVKRPTRTALAIELCARATLPPPNLQESPLIKDARGAAKLSRDQVLGLSAAGGGGAHGSSHHSRSDPSGGGPDDLSDPLKALGLGDVLESKRASTTRPSDDASGDDESEGPTSGIAGMRMLWKKGREQFEQRQTAKRKSPTEEDMADAARAVRGLEGKNTDGSAPSAYTRGATALEEENVALVRPTKKRKIEMAKDLQIGTLIIPLNHLPLDKAVNKKEATRIEKWYQFANTDFMVPDSSTPSWRRESSSKQAPRRSPSILLEISFSSPEVLDESEDEMDEIDEVAEENQNSHDHGTDKRQSIGRRLSTEIRMHTKADTGAADSGDPAPSPAKIEDPMLSPGVVDYICVVGANNVGDQKNDDGAKGWVKTSPECAILEQFPPNDEFHINNGRNVVLTNKVEWFCFPDGWKLWRGTEPPTHKDLKHPVDSARLSSAIPAFDACLNCATSFGWFVISSNSDDYGSKNTKTYGAIIRFYAPAPPGIDLTQDDYAQHGVEKPESRTKGKSTAKRLWVPMGICLTSNLPIVGTMEAMLLRICESLASRSGKSLKSSTSKQIQAMLHEDIANLIINYQTPIAGVLHCSIPFLSGERFHLTLPPPTGLPPLPHGSSVTAACRILGADGLNLLLAAMLTECKILLHSRVISNIALIAEVGTALMYPFYWALPYIPILPDAMLEFIEAPLSYVLGVPSSSIDLIDPEVLADIVVIDLDNDPSSTVSEGRKAAKTFKLPTPIPSAVASNISKAVFRLLRAEEEVEEEYGASNFPGSRSLPRLEAESLAEREFRISVALQVCSLVRGYDDCLFKVSASQPVFNRDKFLRTAPALFDDHQRGNLPKNSSSQGAAVPPRTLSARSKRFLSLLVNCQHFHQFLESLDHDDTAFFNEVMYALDMNNEKREIKSMGRLARGQGQAKLEEAVSHLSKALQKVEDKVPTYRVEKKKKSNGYTEDSWDTEYFDDGGLSGLDGLMGGGGNKGGRDMAFADDATASTSSLKPSFTASLLQQVLDPAGAQARLSASQALFDQRNSDDDRSDDRSVDSSQSGEGIRSLSLQYLVELEKNNWRYTPLFDIPTGMRQEGEEAADVRPAVVENWEKVKLREAIGERRYRAWKLAQDQKSNALDSSFSALTAEVASADGAVSLDLTSLLSSAADDATSETSLMSQSTMSSSSSAPKRTSMLSPEQQRVADAKDRDVLRRCLERAYEGGSQRRTSRVARRSTAQTAPPASSADLFIENGRDLIAEAEAALRNPSAQKFLLNVLSQRSRLENQRKRRQNQEESRGGRRQANQSSISRLEPTAFECLVRLCHSMLDACIESEAYEPAYDLLKQTAGFCVVISKQGEPLSTRAINLSHDEGNQIVYMTTRIGSHPIFAELALWEKVLSLHLKNRDNDKTGGSSYDRGSTGDSSVASGNMPVSEVAEYEAAVATLYEMLGFGVPAEELARFATRVSEERGWFATERGHSLLMLTRRLTARREHGDDSQTGSGENSILGASKHFSSHERESLAAHPAEQDEILRWREVGWCHPAAAKSVSRLERDKPDSKYLKRSAVTSIAAFGSSIVASGGLDGSVFVAHTIRFGSEDDKEEYPAFVSGARLDWGSSGSKSVGMPSTSSSMDGEYGVGAVSCLAAAKGAGYRHAALSPTGSRHGDAVGVSDEDDFLASMEGCRVVAGTTGGDLRVWSVKDVYAATVLAKKNESLNDSLGALGQMRQTHNSGEGASSSFVAGGSKKGSITEIAAGNAFSRLKFSLRGRALSGHRGGVTCIDVPSHIYRPDSLVTGGADGFIKLWSLRQPAIGRRNSAAPGAPGANMLTPSMIGATRTDRSQAPRGKTRGGDALSILSGHTGRVLCVKTAWHGDRLVSGGADQTLRIWDMAGSGGKCLHALSGHLGWVTHAQHWGPNTIVSASTDRSVALWDARVRRAPLFVLRHHHSPISSILVGSRTDPVMVSAAGDGTIATWDFRSLSGTDGGEASAPGKGKKCSSIRTPIATMRHAKEGKVPKLTGPITLARGVASRRKTVLSVGVDSVMREWDLITGHLVSEEASGHCDVVSSLTTFSDAQNAMVAAGMEQNVEMTAKDGGIITSSWDGTLRMRKFSRKL